MELKKATKFTAKDLSIHLNTRVGGVIVDDHRIWLDRLVRMIETFEALAFMILILIVLATVGTVVFTTRTGLAIHREAIEVLHLMGAHDEYMQTVCIQGLKPRYFWSIFRFGFSFAYTLGFSIYSRKFR